MTAPLPIKNLEDLLHRMTDRIRQSLELAEILEATVDEMRRFLKTDRVKVYQFHEDGSGEVVAESIRNQQLPSLLGQHFPAEDIPPEARSLFLTARQRSIVNVAKQEIGISPLLSEETKEDLFSRIAFRSVDPCHVEYLKAMGVQASLVVPILHHYQLWGLLVAHHSIPKRFGNRELEIVQLIADQASVAIAHASLLQLTRLQGRHESIINQTVSHLHSTAKNPIKRALGQMVTAFQCAGGRIYISSAETSTNAPTNTSISISPNAPTESPRDSPEPDNLLAFPNSRIQPSKRQPSNFQLITQGTQPTLPRNLSRPERLSRQQSDDRSVLLERLVDWPNWLKAESAHQIVANLWAISDIRASNMPSDMRAALASGQIRGILVAKLIHQNHFLGYLSLFRHAMDIETIWAGRLDASDPRQQLPRQSFAAWREVKREQADPWTSQEIGLAQDLADRFASAVYQAQLYQKIQTLNADLEARVAQRTAQLQATNKDLKREIAERERALKALQDAKDSLKRISHQNELILNAAGEGIYGIDPKGKIVFINPAAAKILGRNNRSMVGKFTHDLIQHAKPDGEPYSWKQSPIFNTLRYGKTHHVTGDLFIRQDGLGFPVEYVSTSIQEKGKIIGAVVIFQDITERQAIESMRDQFIAVVSHELRTPLTSIRAALGLLSKKGLDIPMNKRQRMIEIASSNTNRLVRLVSDILDIERMKLGKITLNKNLCDLSAIMTQSADEMRAMADKRNISLSISPLSVQLWADPD
ncbi:MAG: GAF domain-containing protein [Phormidesmis sp.]